MVSNFLKDNGCSLNEIEAITELIESTWQDDEPKNDSEKILKDVGTWFYASEDFEEMLQLLRMELENLNESIPDLDTWRLSYVEKLRIQHKFYTEFAK